MRSYQIEDLSHADGETLQAALRDLGLAGSIDGIFYLPVPHDLLDAEQCEHLDSCGPFFMPLEVIEGPERTMLKLELLVRARQILRCSCVHYAPPALRNHMIDYLDCLLEDLDVRV